MDIRLHRNEQRGGRVWELAEDSLAPDDDELALLADLGRGSDEVFELLSRHLPGAVPNCSITISLDAGQGMPVASS